MSGSSLPWVALGGALGSMLRYALGEALRRLPGSAAFPWGTIVINVAGSFVLGWFLRWATASDASPQLRAFVAVGLCGGFTTFSTFAVEHLALLQAGHPTRAAAQAILSLAGAVLAAGAGYAVARG